MSGQLKDELARLVRAFGYSMAGLKAAVRYEAAFRQELKLAVVLTPLGLWLGDNGAEYALLISSLLLLLITELVNSAIETTVDRLGEEFHPLAGRAKDISSAAVFLAIGNVGLVWGLTLLVPQFV